MKAITKTGKFLFVPLLGSSMESRLGVLQLGRTWLKVSLEEHTRLAPGYPGYGGGFDTMLFTAIGLNPDDARGYIRTARPTLVQFEDWVKAQPGVKLDAETVVKINQDIRRYEHGPEERKRIFDLVGLTDETCSYRDAVRLNAYEDAHLFHLSVLRDGHLSVLTEDNTTTPASNGENGGGEKEAAASAEEKSNTVEAPAALEKQPELPITETQPAATSETTAPEGEGETAAVEQPAERTGEPVLA